MANTLRSLAIAALTLLLFTPPPAANAAPSLHAGSCQGACWASYAFRTEGGQIQVQVTARSIRLPIQLGVLLYDANSSDAPEKLVFSWTYLLLDPDSGAFVSVAGDPGIDVDTRAPQSTRNSLALTVTINDQGADVLGTYRVLMWAAGTVAETGYDLQGGTGTSYLGHDVGTRTFMYTSTEFRGLLNVQAGTGSSEARLNQGVRTVLDITDTMVGLFGPAGGEPSPIDELTVEGPGGTRKCPCFFSNFGPAAQGLPPATAGRYTFQIQGGDAKPGNSAEIVLAGADARLAL